ncbi:MAG: hypothetical protein LBP19_02820 [Treponema sp.]|nr:hypothetical protein [Treponema sp.]
MSKISNIEKFNDVYLGFDDSINCTEIVTHAYYNILELLEIEFNEQYLINYFRKRIYNIENKMAAEKTAHNSTVYASPQ